MTNPLYSVLDSYYDTQYVLDEDSPDYDESAIIYDYGIPLDQRESDILTTVEKLLAEGVDLNNAPDGDYPLRLAVGNLDPEMVHYLILHGADCRRWLAEDEEPDPDVRNHYFDVLDYLVMEESFVTSPNVTKFEAAFRVACILVKEGGLQDPYHGYCLQITENREIIMHQAQVKF